MHGQRLSMAVVGLVFKNFFFYQWQQSRVAQLTIHRQLTQVQINLHSLPSWSLFAGPSVAPYQSTPSRFPLSLPRLSYAPPFALLVLRPETPSHWRPPTSALAFIISVYLLNTRPLPRPASMPFLPLVHFVI
jgi:hypothetical protein